MDTKILAGLTTPLDLLNENGYDSFNLYKEVMALEPAQVKRTQLGLKWVLDNNLQSDVVIVGGTAVAHHSGVPRPLTPDLDFIVRDLQHIQTLLDDQQIEHQPLEFVDGSHTGISVPQFDADFMMMTNDELNSLLIDRSVPGRIGGGNFRLVSSEMLTVLKMLTGRNKDLEDGVKLVQCIKKNGTMACLKDLAKELRKGKHITKDQHQDVQSFIF